MSGIANVPGELRDELSRISSESDTQWLMDELKSCLQITVHQIIKLAAIVKRLEECGVELTVEFSMLPYVRRVAYGQMLPDLLVALQGDAVLLEKSAQLPLPDQQRISQNKPLKVMEIGGDHRKVPPLSMTRREIRQVFGRGKLRSDGEQIGWLRDEILKRKKAEPPENMITVDKRRGGIVVNGCFVSSREMAHYLGELSPRKASP